MSAKIDILNPSLFSTGSRTHSHSRLQQLRYCSTISASAAVSNRTLPRPILSLKPHQPTCWMQLPSSSSSPSSPSSSVAAMWRDIQGAGDWEHLLQPLHPLLRRETIRYAELVLACYRAFDLDPSSKRYLNCKYGKSTLLRDVGMTTAGYEITKYIYATPGITIPTQTEPCTSHWIGYVAVSNDKTSARLGRRDILVSFRGTVTNTEWIANFMSSLTPARLDPINPRADVMVESGFLSIYTSDDTKSCFGTGSCRQQLLVEISKLIRKYRDEEDISITLAGHSMGSSLALLLGYDIAELGLNRAGEIPITVYSFAGPRVGNSGFKSRCEELGVKVLRVANVNDPVTKMPGLFFNEGFKGWAGKMELPWMGSTCYAHVGVELALDFFDIQNPACVHDLDAYIDRLKCASMQKVKEEEDDLFTKLMEFLSSHMFDSCPFSQDSESHGGEMVQ